MSSEIAVEQRFRHRCIHAVIEIERGGAWREGPCARGGASYEPGVSSIVLGTGIREMLLSRRGENPPLDTRAARRGR
jgi:hypothetical protein